MFTGYHIKYFVLIFLLVTSVIYSQQTDTEILQSRIAENGKLFVSEPDKAFLQTTILLEEAINVKDYSSELLLVSHQCWYYHYSSDIDSLILSAQLLKRKAIEYKIPRFQAVAHNYLLFAYTVNQLYDKGIAEFNKAMSILDEEDEKRTDIIIAKTNSYTYLSNLYAYKGEYKKVLSCLFSVAEQLEKLEDKNKKMEMQHSNYANIASRYIEINPDSAEYYAHKSMELKQEKYYQNDPIAFLNYSVLGDVNRKKGNYKEALEYYHRAETIIPEKSNNIENQREMFQGMLQVYEALSDTINANQYQLKLKDTELKVAQSKNKSLHRILEDNHKESPNKTWYIVLILFLIVVVITISTYHLQRKNKLLQEQERQGREYLDTQSNREQSYKDLIGLFQKNDPDFMGEFLKVFPSFPEKLRVADPSIREGDIEFSALLKLNIPTKEIARWKNLAPKTINNHKYLIRKRLNIPDNMELYYWFSQF